jgi:hypothetical protein
VIPVGGRILNAANTNSNAPTVPLPGTNGALVLRIPANSDGRNVTVADYVGAGAPTDADRYDSAPYTNATNRFRTVQLRTEWDVTENFMVKAGAVWRRFNFDVRSFTRDTAVCGNGGTSLVTSTSGTIACSPTSLFGPTAIYGFQATSALSEVFNMGSAGQPAGNTNSWLVPNLEAATAFTNLYSRPLVNDAGNIRGVQETTKGAYLQFDAKGDLLGLEYALNAGIRYAKAVDVAVDDSAQCMRMAEVLQHDFAHVQIVARARDAMHAMELAARKVHYVEREVFESSLRSGRSVLELLGVDRDQAKQMADNFRRYSLAILQNAQAERHNEEGLIMRVRQAREQFEREMQADQERQTRHDGKAGWHAPE